MRRWLLCALLIAGIPAMSKSIFPYTSHKEVLPNGLTVYLIPMESPGLVAYYSIVRTGSRDEYEPGKSGFAHFFEHMMFRGTKRHPGPVYDSLITGIGAEANAYTTDDYTAYHLKFATEDLEKVMDLESDRFQNLSYEEREFQTEAGAVYGEYRKSITSPFALLNEKLQDAAYDVHTYKHTTIGFEADIKAMPGAYAYSKSFYERYYRPDNVVILIAGDFHMQGTLTLVRKYYCGWRKGYVPPRVPQEPPQKKERTATVTYAGKTLPILDIAYKGEAFDPANRTYVAAILLGDLAFGETSDLYKKLYIREQKVEFIQPGIPMNRDMPLFEIIAMVKREEDVAGIREEVYRAIARFQQNPVDAQTLADMKRRRKYEFLMHLDTPDKVAGGLARFVALTGGIEVVDRFYTMLARITPADIQKAAREYFTPERRTVGVLKGGGQ
ncbi:MAG TPA: pitrilysin family protein [Bacteroidota bacterium]|nr:pitrilysin family protein [Bacteroidota bacterium]